MGPVVVVVLPFAQLLVEQVNIVGYAAPVQELVELLVVSAMRALSFALRHPFALAFFIYGGGGFLEFYCGIQLCDQIPLHLEFGTVSSFDLVLLRGPGPVFGDVYFGICTNRQSCGARRTDRPNR